MLKSFTIASAVILLLISLSGEVVLAQNISPLETPKLQPQHSNPENIPPSNSQAIQALNVKKTADKRLVHYNQVLLEADTAYLAGDYNTAILGYREALSLKPSNQILYLKLGEAYFSAGEDEEAFIIFKTYLKKSTSASARTHYVLGLLFERQGNIDAALNEYNLVMTIDPNHSGARRRRADIYLIRGKLKKAINEYEKSHKASPNNPIILYKLSRVYLKDKQFDKAIGAYRKAINLDDGNIEIQREYALLLKRLGHYHEAEIAYIDILKKQPDDEDALNGTIFVLVKQKKYDELILFLKKEQKRDTSNPDHPYRLGLIYEYRHMYQEALDAYKRSLELKASAKTYLALGRVMIKAGKKAEAKIALESARRIDPKASEVRSLLMQLKAGNRTKIFKKTKKKISKFKNKRAKQKKWRKKPKQLRKIHRKTIRKH